MIITKRSRSRSRSRIKDTVPQPPKRICAFLIVEAEAKDVVFASAKFFLYHHNAYEHIGSIISDLAELGHSDDVLCILRFVQWLNEVD